MKPRIQCALTQWNPGFTGPAGSEARPSWLGSTINVPEMRHHTVMRLFLGNLLPIEETSRLRRFGSDGALASAEQASGLLDAIRDVS